MNITLLLQQILNGLAIGSIYAIFALGYTLMFSILGVINFAHTAVFTLGAYFTYWLTGSAWGFSGLLQNQSLPVQLPFILAMLLGAVLAGLIGILVERIAFRPLRARKADPLLALVSSLGLSVAIVNIIQYLVGTQPYQYPSDPFGALPTLINFGTPQHPLVLQTTRAITFVVSMVMLVLLTYMMNYTKLGKALRAVAEDTTTASLLGINTDRLILITFFLSAFLGGIAGTLVGLMFSISRPDFGTSFGLKGLAVIVLGGLGDIPGSVLGGMLMGIAESLLPSDLNAYKDAVAYVLLFVVLLIRPRGLLGRATVQKV